MKTIKYSYLLLLGALLAAPLRADLVDFHFGGVDQTGPAVLGSTGDAWNTGTTTNGGPMVLKNASGAITPVSVSWTSGDSWAATKSISNDDLKNTAMDAGTTWLMRSFASSYQYSSWGTHLGVTLTGLTPNQTYTLVLIGSGDQTREGTIFTVTGNGTFTGSTSGHDRKLSNGPGDAYVTLVVVSSTQGKLAIGTAQNGYHWAVLNGFQLQSNTSTAVATVTAAPAPVAPTATASSTSAAAVVSAPVIAAPTAVAPSIIQAAMAPAAYATSARTMAWGICGHPTWSDYANWTPANVTTQVGYLQQLGCKYYRCSFEGATGPSTLDTTVPKAQAAGITVLPILSLWLNVANTAQVTHDSNYQTAYAWATYAISKGYALPYWEIGNELENWGLVNVVSDGTSPTQYPDNQPGGFVTIASGLSGAYQGIKDAYAAGRQNGLTTITPQVLYGATYRHWGLLAKIQQYNGTLPCDIISWHWYGPCYGGFNTTITDNGSASIGRTPVQCLNDFKSKTNPSQPMDIWITETNRSSKTSTGGFLNGSVNSLTAPSTVQDWAAEATSIQTNVDSFKTVPSVKGIFVYELLDEPKADSTSTARLASEGYFGLVTGLNGVLKTAFYTYQTEIKTGL